ncbi:hypothetical protein KR200_008570 [Drosophila serrata]|nr:hypothetical protein KR200_008570 [Drosophila serrata]
MTELSNTQRWVRSTFCILGATNTEELSLTISSYDELVTALMLRCEELETRLTMPPPPSLPVAASCFPVLNVAKNAAEKPKKSYCQFDAPQEPYLRYMDAVRLQASRNAPKSWASTRMQFPPCGLANSLGMPRGKLTTAGVSWRQEPPP